MHIPSASPVLPVPVGSEAGMWGPPPTPTTMSTSHHLQSPTREADVLPLFWEFNSGDGVTCGASLWETVSLFAQFIGSFCFVSLNCSLSPVYTYFVAKMSKIAIMRFGGQVRLQKCNGGQVR